MRSRIPALFFVSLLSSCSHKSPPPNVPEVPIDQASFQDPFASPSAKSSRPLDAPDHPGPSALDNVLPPGAPWYNPEPLLCSIRPSARSSILSEIGVQSLDMLPLYDLHLSINPDSRSFDLAQDVYFTNLTDAPLPDLMFRIYGNQSAQPPIAVTQANCIDSPCVFSYPHASVILVRPQTPIAPHARLHLSFAIAGHLEFLEASRTDFMAQNMEAMATMSGNAKPSGNYGLLSVSDGFVSMAGFFPILAHRSQSGWEKVESVMLGDFGSDDLSNVRATVNIAPTFDVVTPGVVVKDSVFRDASRSALRRQFNIAAAATRDFSLFAGVALASSVRQIGDVRVASYYSSADASSGQRVLDIASAALSFFETKFGPYPYAELDAVEAPIVGGAGGVEFAGTIALANMYYRPSALDSSSAGALMGLLGQGGDASSGNLIEDILEFTTAHEVAHQWWHALVGNNARLNPFLDESLTQYSTLLYYEDRYGQQRAKQAADTHLRMNYQMMRMMGGTDGSVDRPVSAFVTPTAYAGLVYGKGPFFYEAARKQLGDSAFFGALRAYANDNRFRTASERGPIDALAAAGHAAQIRSLAHRWLDEHHGDKDLGTANAAQAAGAGALGSDPQINQLLQQFGGAGQGIQTDQMMKLLQEVLGGAH